MFLKRIVVTIDQRRPGSALQAFTYVNYFLVANVE